MLQCVNGQLAFNKVVTECDLFIFQVKNVIHVTNSVKPCVREHFLYFVVILFTKTVAPRSSSWGESGPALKRFADRWHRRILDKRHSPAAVLKL